MLKQFIVTLLNKIVFMLNILTKNWYLAGFWHLNLSWIRFSDSGRESRAKISSVKQLQTSMPSPLKFYALPWGVWLITSITGMRTKRLLRWICLVLMKGSKIYSGLLVKVKCFCNSMPSDKSWFGSGFGRDCRLFSKFWIVCLASAFQENQSEASGAIRCTPAGIFCSFWGLKSHPVGQLARRRLERCCGTWRSSLAWPGSIENNENSKRRPHFLPYFRNLLMRLSADLTTSNQIL